MFYTIIVLFGAPLTTHTPQTLLAAAHITLLSTYPLSSSLPPSLETVRQLITLEYSTDVDVLKWTYWGGIGTVLGAWLGAVPIPLDWDRDWQVSSQKFTSLIREMANHYCRGSIYWTRNWIDFRCCVDWAFQKGTKISG